MSRTRNNWAVGGAITRAELADLDRKQFAAINGDGGTYAPVYPITIAGSGLQATLARVDYGGTLTIADGATTQIGDWLKLETGNSHRLVTDLVPISDGVLFPMPEAEVANVGNPCGVMPLASTILGEQVRIVVPFRPRVGRITQVTLTFRVMHNADVPKSSPRARVLRIDADGIPQAISTWATYASVSNAEQWVEDHRAKYLSILCADTPKTSTRLIAEATGNTLRVVNSERFAVDDFIEVNAELMQVVSVDGASIKVVRTGTTAHATGSTVATVTKEPLTTIDESNYTYAIEIEPEGSVDVNAALVDRVELPDTSPLSASIDNVATTLHVSNTEDLFGMNFTSYPVDLSRTLRVGDEWMSAYRVLSITAVSVVRGVSSTAAAHTLGDSVECFDNSGPRASSSEGVEVVLWAKSVESDLNGVYKRDKHGAYKISTVEHVLDAKTGSWYSKQAAPAAEVPGYATVVTMDIVPGTGKLPVTDLSVFKSDRAVLRINNELLGMYGKDVDANSIIVIRGYQGTTADDHLSGTPIYIVDEKKAEPVATYRWVEITDGVPFGPLAWWVSAQVEYEIDELR